MKTTVKFSGERIVTATYRGGAYIDLAFGWHTQPTEVINVWDYETSTSLIADPTSAPRDEQPAIRDAIRHAVREWANSNEEEGWVDWYDGYMENARSYA